MIFVIQPLWSMIFLLLFIFLNNILIIFIALSTIQRVAYRLGLACRQIWKWRWVMRMRLSKAVSPFSWPYHKLTSCQLMSTCSSFKILLPLKIMTILGCSQAPRMQTSNMHCLLSSSDPDWLTVFLNVYRLIGHLWSTKKGIGDWPRLKHWGGRKRRNLLSYDLQQAPAQIKSSLVTLWNLIKSSLKASFGLPRFICLSASGHCSLSKMSW